MNREPLIRTLPPGLTVWQGAALLRRPYFQVRGMMRRYGYVPLDGRRLRWRLSPAKYRIPWRRVNWRMTNAAIARQFGCSREIVRRMRGRVGRPVNKA